MFKIPAITLSIVMMFGASAHGQTQTQVSADSASARPTFRTNLT